jgi:hypothetical protein
MKKFFVSAGLMALGTATTMQSAMAASVDAVVPNNWNVSASLRGFYDDNYNIANSGKGSFGLELTPSISYHVPLQQTDMGIRYTYGLYYYQDRDALGVNPFDQTHQVDLWFDHAFNERWHTRITDTFAVGQEPELIGPTPTVGNPINYRINGNNLANHAAIALNTDWTRLFSTGLSYDNSFYDYQNKGATTGLLNNDVTFPVPGYIAATPPLMLARLGIPGWQAINGAASGSGPTYAGLLDRIEQSVSLDLKWHVQPETTVFVGYQLSWVNYTGNEPIAVVNYANGPVGVFLGPPASYLVPNPGTAQSFVYHSSDRDSITHYAYVGIEHEFTASLSGSLRGGVSDTDSYADPLNPSTSLAPYADVSLTYTYMPGSYVQLGFTQDVNATDQVTPDSSGNITQFAQSSVIYLDVNHRFTPKLSGTLIGRMQYSTYQGGVANSQDETDYSLGINFSYEINRHFSMDAGYNFDDLVSGTGLTDVSYTRNRVYLGLSASY